MKNSKVVSIAALGVVTVLAFGAVYGTKVMSNKGNSDLEAIVLQANESLGIKSVEKYLDENDEIAGYSVVVVSAGYIGDVEMKVCFDADATTITKLEILSQGETEGLGSKITGEDFLSQFEGMTAPVYIEGVSLAQTVIQKAIAPEAENAVLNDGEYTAEGEMNNGWQSFVTITVDGGKITSVNWDAKNEAGELKSEASENGSYVMTEDGPTWAQQSASLSQFVVEQQGTSGIVMDENTKTDTVAGVSISVYDFVSLTDACIAQSKSGETVSTNGSTLVDGTYVVDSGDFDNSGYKSILTLIVEGGNITRVTWDAMDRNGEYKSYLSTAGKYVMVEGNPTWKEQADALAASVIENQSLEGITLDDNGKTDSVAGVSISVNGFIDLCEKALELAATGEGAAVSEETTGTGSTENATKMDAISGATFSSKAVMEGINTAYEYLQTVK